MPTERELQERQTKALESIADSLRSLKADGWIFAVLAGAILGYLWFVAPIRG
jgi:hypothetical protein